MVKNLPSNVRDAGSIPGWGTKIPYAAGQLSLHTVQARPELEGSPCATGKDPACFNEILCTATKIQYSQSKHTTGPPKYMK